ncbi:MAG TPA: hypothetical protein PK014_11140 [Thermoanaerobaculia bacterium]|nr:hypothetical protein [Thermoanaerobaculia bacterium]HUM30679.1 hypothetical protein [Thermoanaerobaculia bacterium]HXK68913.1 hypothetical protein [Thermoanaerobaculia bacterium]
MKIIAGLLAALFLVMGVLFMVAAFHPVAKAQGLMAGRLIIGGILLSAGAVMIYLSRLKPIVREVNVHQTFEAPGQLNLEKLKCDQCGGVLSAKNMTIVSGAAMINCPYCGATYQVEEEPKW